MKRRMTLGSEPLPPRRTKPFPRDVFRLAKGAAALALPEPRTLKEMQDQLPILHGAWAAMQSLDDLGDDEANHKAHADEAELQRRCGALEQRIKRKRKG